METTDYCDYELAKKLNACGFDEPCDHYYTHEDAPDGAVWLTGDPRTPRNYNGQQDGCPFAKPICSAPTLWQAQKWLREKKGVAINVIAHDGGKYSHEHVYLPNYDESTTQWGIWHINHTPLFDTYEEALSAGIAEILRLLVGKESEQP